MKKKNNLKLEIEKLKNEQKELLFYDVKILGTTEETKGISIGISFLEEQFYNILDIGKEFNENYLLFSLNMNVKDIKKMNEIEKFFEDNKEIMSNLFKKSDKDFIKLRKIENKIFFDLMVHIYQRRDIDVIDFITKIVHINVFKNIKINLNSNFKVGYFFEKMTFKFFLNELLKIQFLVKGLSINSKFLFYHLIDLLKEELKKTDEINKDNKIFNFLNFVKTLLIINNFDLIFNNEIKEGFLRIIATHLKKSDLNSEDVIFNDEKIKTIKKTFKNIELLKNINLNNFSIIFSLPLKYKIGLEFKFEVENLNEIFDEKFLK